MNEYWIEIGKSLAGAREENSFDPIQPWLVAYEGEAIETYWPGEILFVIVELHHLGCTVRYGTDFAQVKDFPLKKVGATAIFDRPLAQVKVTLTRE